MKWKDLFYISVASIHDLGSWYKYTGEASARLPLLPDYFLLLWLPCHDRLCSALQLWAKIKLSPIGCFVRHCIISARQVPNTMSWTFVLEQLVGGLCTRPIWKVDLESDWTMQIYWLIVEITHWFCTCSNSFYWMGVGKWEIPTEAASLFILCVIKNKRSTYLPCRKIT